MCGKPLEWQGLKIANQKSLYVGWKKWGRKHKSKNQRKFFMLRSLTVYHIWYARNFSLWNEVMIHLAKIVQMVKHDVSSRVKSLVIIKGSFGSLNWNGLV